MPDTPLRVVVLGRSIYGLHGFGGLERHLFDLVRHHLAAGWQVTVVTRTPRHPEGADPERWQAVGGHPQCTVRFVPYHTFPLAGRAGTTIVDRSTAYPWFGWRAGRVAARLAAAGAVDVVYGVGASVWGYARRRRPLDAPLVFNPQGLEEFGGFDGTYGGQALKRYGYAPLQAVVRDCARRSDAVIATDRAIVPLVHRHLPVTDARVRLIPNGIDVDALDALADRDAALGMRVRAKAGADDALLLSVGRIDANKGFSDLATPCRRSTAAPAGDGPWSATARLATRCSPTCRHSASAIGCSWPVGSTTAPFTRGMARLICSCTRHAMKAARWSHWKRCCTGARWWPRAPAGCRTK